MSDGKFAARKKGKTPQGRRTSDGDKEDRGAKEREERSNGGAKRKKPPTKKSTAFEKRR